MAKKETTEEKVNISLGMIKNCKDAIAKFGWNHYEKFLVSVKALKDDGRTVLQYRNQDIVVYAQAFLKQHEVSLSDAFILDRFKIFTSNEAGHQYETGYFCPRSFWDWILNYKLS